MRYGDAEFGRGCPYACTFCIIPYLRKTFKVRKYPRKENDRMIKELVDLKNKYQIEMFRFWDELFLFVNDEQLSEFGMLYKKFVNLPLIIETTAESITETRVDILAQMGCVSISIGIETGNAELRNKVLNKKTSDETYIKKFKIINSRHINSTSYNMIGLPGETEDMILQTVELNKKCNVKTPSVNLFYPYPGTHLRQYCIEKGYLEPHFEDNLEESILYTTTVLKQEHIIKLEKLRHYLQYFSAYCRVPSQIDSGVP